MVARGQSRPRRDTLKSGFDEARVDELKHEACYLCGSRDIAPYWSGFNAVRRDRRWYVAICHHCGLAFMSPQPSAVEDSLWAGPPFRAFLVDARPSRRKQICFEEWERRVLKHVFRGRLLDVGFGMGEFWRAADGAGWDAYGIDIHATGVAQARDFWKTDRLIAGRIGDVPSLFSEPFDVVNLSQIVEHLPDPLAGIRSAAQVLRSGGLLTIDVPNVRSASGRLDRGRVMDVPAHLYYWSSGTLRRALEICGFRVLEVTSGFGLANLLGRVIAPRPTARIAGCLR